MNDSAHDANPALSHPGNIKPWYRYGWVWFVLGLLSMSISASLTLVTMAYRHADDVVSDTWYRDGRGINQDMAAQEMARALAIRVQISGNNGEIRARLHSDAELPLPASLEMTLRHPTIAARDAVFELTLMDDTTGEDQYRAEGELPRGRWVATLTPVSGHWRVQDQVWVENQRLTIEAR